MYKDIVVIIAIILTSYIFTLRQGNQNGLFNPQLMYILLALGMIVLYKVIHYKKLSHNTEGFENDVASEMNRFIEGQVNDNVADRLSTLSETDRQRYTDQIANLSSQIAVLNQRLTDNNNSTNDINSNLGTNDTMNLETIQKMQNFQIDYLQKQIERSKQLLQQQEIEENIRKYKPIKVYSSCAVSSADGSFNEDSLTATRSNTTTLTNDQVKSVADMLNTIGQTGAGNVETNNQNSENVLGNLLAGVLNGQQTSIQLT